MPFEKFTRPKPGQISTPTLRIGPTGHISMSTSAHEAIGAPADIYLLWDPDAAKVAIQAAPERDDASYRFKSRQTTAAPFVRHIRFDSPEPVTFPVTIEGDMAIAEVSEVVAR